MITVKAAADAFIATGHNGKSKLLAFLRWRLAIIWARIKR
jgi:hypothetical protein